MCRSGLDILHIRGEGRILEFATGVTQAGKVEPQNSKAHRGQTLRDSAGRRDVFAACEAMGEERGGQNRAIRHIKPRGQRLACVTGECQLVERHGRFRCEWVLVYVASEQRACKVKVTCVTRR